MRDRFTGRSRGFGFVIFESEDITIQVSKTAHTLDGRQVRSCVKLCVPSTEQFDLILPTCVVSRVVLGADRSRPSERSPARPSRCEASEPRRSLWAA